MTFLDSLPLLSLVPQTHCPQMKCSSTPKTPPSPLQLHEATVSAVVTDVQSRPARGATRLYVNEKNDVSPSS